MKVHLEYYPSNKAYHFVLRFQGRRFIVPSDKEHYTFMALAKMAVNGELTEIKMEPEKVPPSLT